jgi:hypothetical protein
LNNNTRYIVTIPAHSVTDTSANDLPADYSFSFATGDGQNTILPTVGSTDPANGATGVAINNIISVTFSENIVESVNFGDISISNGNSVVSYTYSLEGTTLTLDPTGDLANNTTYTVIIPAGAVKNTTGNPLANDFNFSFTTETVESPSGIIITIPNGGETCQTGLTRDITWSYTGDACSSDARISLYKGGVYQYTIVNSVPLNSGSYSWAIPGSQAAGDDYKIRITCNANINVRDYNDANFTISSSP